MIFSLLQIRSEGVEGWKLGDHMELAGPVVVIILFLIERVISYREKKKERRSNWYYSVVVIPNLKCINDFFHDYTLRTKDSYTKFLKESQTGTPSYLNSIKMIQFADLSELIREFDLQFLMILYMFNPSRYQELNTIVSNMRDEVLRKLDRFQDPNNSLDEINRTIAQNKSIFFDQLYLAIDDK